MADIERGPRAADNFAMIANTALADARLSYRARGLLAFLLSRPAGWRTSSEALAKQGAEGRDAVRTALRELQEHGYLQRSTRNEGGRWDHTLYVTDAPETDFQAPVFQAPENPAPDSQAVSTKKENYQEGELHKKENNTSAVAAVAVREDVALVCNALADAIEANGSKRPTITKGWHTAARLLIDKDGHPVDKVLRAIAWCQADEFWRANILSMPKLREKYDTLRLQAQRATPPARATTEDRIRAGLEHVRSLTLDTDPAHPWAAVAPQIGN